MILIYIYNASGYRNMITLVFFRMVVNPCQSWTSVWLCGMQQMSCRVVTWYPMHCVYLSLQVKNHCNNSLRGCRWLLSEPVARQFPVHIQYSECPVAIQVFIDLFSSRIASVTGPTYSIYYYIVFNLSMHVIFATGHKAKF